MHILFESRVYAWLHWLTYWLTDWRIVSWPHPISHEEKGLVTIEWFLSCAESTIVILDKPMRKCHVIQECAKTMKYASILFKINTADMAQLLNCHQTHFLVTGAWGPGMRLTDRWTEQSLYPLLCKRVHGIINWHTGTDVAIAVASNARRQKCSWFSR